MKESIEIRATLNENEENKIKRKYIFEARNLKDIEQSSNQSLTIADSISEVSSETTSIDEIDLDESDYS